MSNSKWSKRWLYDSAVEVPRTTKWRRSLEFNNRTVEEEVVDVRDGRFSSELFDQV